MNQIYHYLYLTRPWLSSIALLAITVAACHGAYRLRFPHLIVYSIAGLLLFLSFFADQMLFGMLEEQTVNPDGSIRFTINQTKAAISMGVQTLGWLAAIAGAYLQITRTRAHTRGPLEYGPRSDSRIQDAGNKAMHDEPASRGY